MSNIYYLFLQSVQKFALNVCLRVEQKEYTYLEMDRRAQQIADLLDSISAGPAIGIVSHRSFSGYLGILGVLKSGRAYVPLNPSHPSERNKKICLLSKIKVFIVAPDALDQMDTITASLDQTEICLVFPENNRQEIQEMKISRPARVFSEAHLNAFNSAGKVEKPLNTELAYIMFTSGSTGMPKGVPITHSKIRWYVDHITKKYLFSPDDRFSQLFDLTFDLSVHDMWVCWSSGATLCIPAKSLLIPKKYILENKITCWFSVPSVGQYMQKYKQVSENDYPLLKYIFFCGEALPESVVHNLQIAAKNAAVENLYGPTEATIAISSYSCSSGNSLKQLNGIVSIGKIFPGQEYCIVNDSGSRVGSGQEGELCLLGPQVITSYYNEADNTDRFITFGESGSWYKTGDIVKSDEENNLYYLGRKDFQVKVQGYRIELEEVNNIIRKFAGSDLVFSINYPPGQVLSECIYTLIDEAVRYSEEEIIAECTANLPNYMVPRSIIRVDSFPVNVNNKIDRLELGKIIEKSIKLKS